ncbi:MAG: citrate/2-methylcitrate synthase [Candidatus Thorarchaeota archaeon]|nr:citrate/2-methylcitrate synthase [Candidatus Thorarchaeota archaeon]
MCMEPISRIDSKTNQLFFKGYNVADFSNSYDFETVLFLLVNGHWPSDLELAAITKKLVKLREFYNDDVDSLSDLAGSLDRIKDDNKLDIHDTLLTFVTLAPLVVANETNSYLNRFVKLPSNSNLGHAANFLWLTKGAIPTETDLRDFQTALILHMDDPDNPSLSKLQESLKKGKSISEVLLSALKAHTNPLHHGAGTEAMAMFQEIRVQSNARRYLAERLDSGGKIYGLGHRIYRGMDPRAIILREMLKRRAHGTNAEWLLQISDIVAQEGRSLLLEKKRIDAYPNVDLYNAAVYSTFGFPPELNTSFFALSRAAGWMAHVLEFHRFK